MDYQSSVQFIHHQPRLAKDGSLDRITALLSALGDPQKDQVYIHVTGTNGKGSTASAIAHVLEASGKRVGLFTSPFIMRFNERFMIDHQPIADATLAVQTTAVKAALQQLQAADPNFVVTEFEFVTALALRYFNQEKVDVAVIEVGIGGLEDSTNVILPQVAVITGVAMDHQALLGHTLQSIAHHKAGIIKPHVAVVTGALPPEAVPEVAAKVAATHSTWQAFGRDFSVSEAQMFDWGQHFDYHNVATQLDGLTIPLVGTYQPQNFAVAITAATTFCARMGWPLTEAQIRAGLQQSTWPGRMEKVSSDPLIILDGAHNPQGISGLIDTVHALFGQQPVTVIAGVLKDKDVTTMVQALGASEHRLWLVPVPGTPRATKAGDYPVGVQHFAQWQDAVAAYRQQFADEPLLITGSLYLVSAVRQAWFGGEKHDHDRVI